MPENCPSDCPMAQRVIALEEDNRRHKETHGKMYDRLGALEKNDAVQSAQFNAIMEKLDRMDVKYDRLTEKMESMERTASKQAQTLEELNERGRSNVARLNALEAEPGKRWKDIVKTVIGGVVTILLGYIALKLGFSS